MTSAYIALGSNLDNPASQLRRALRQLNCLHQCQIESLSGAYSSAAIGPGTQPDYLNAVVKLATALSAPQLLGATQTIENSQGRIRSQRWGPRTLDLDILLYGGEEIHTQSLQIPHPRMAERNFVLYPLAEIAGEKLILPCGGVLGSLLANCPLGDLVRTQVSLDIEHEPG
ncbi:MAG: 2-amino-4-hydroxy-6-hydroxymethyldihydropteridine diphosphokinase [Proteobacteria bacterium]|nr:2-amino-4-hydroxy-6-hydroxymethyldihydropteridine diphosphokinase [Pseudomonadota bacterium]